MLDKPIAIVDIETTGWSAKSGRVLEIAVLKIYDNAVVARFNSLVDPEEFIPPQITQLTGIRGHDVSGQPTFAELAPRLNELFDDSYFLAHSVLFDFSFIKKQMAEVGYQFSPRLLCSVKLSRALYSNERSHSLENIIRRHSIEVEDRHRAMADVEAVWQFMQLARTEHGDEVVAAALKKQLVYKSLPSNFDASFLDGIENTPGVYIFRDANGAPVYVGKSKHLRKRILSHFTASTKLDKEMKISLSTHKLEVIRCQSELEALLLESKLVKELLPLHNRMLRRKRERVLLHVQETPEGYPRVEMTTSKDIDVADMDSVMGVHDNRTSAKQTLEAIREQHKLCSKLLGLERTKSACFYYRLGKCAGACILKEPPELYRLRLMSAFANSRLKSWPYKGPVTLHVSPQRQLVVDQWSVLGVYDDGNASGELDSTQAYPFDYDTYKILAGFMRAWPQLVSNVNSYKA